MQPPRTHGVDPQGAAVNRQYAVIYAPGKKRARFAENCVRPVASAAEALQQADPSAQQFPALVYGPSVSSEGLRLYYLIEWLEGGG